MYLLSQCFSETPGDRQNLLFFFISLSVLLFQWEFVHHYAWCINNNNKYDDEDDDNDHGCKIETDSCPGKCASSNWNTLLSKSCLCNVYSAWENLGLRLCLAFIRGFTNPKAKGFFYLFWKPAVCAWIKAIIADKYVFFVSFFFIMAIRDRWNNKLLDKLAQRKARANHKLFINFFARLLKSFQFNLIPLWTWQTNFGIFMLGYKYEKNNILKNVVLIVMECRLHDYSTCTVK